MPLLTQAEKELIATARQLALDREDMRYLSGDLNTSVEEGSVFLIAMTATNMPLGEVSGVMENIKSNDDLTLTQVFHGNTGKVWKRSSALGDGTDWSSADDWVENDSSLRITAVELDAADAMATALDAKSIAENAGNLFSDGSVSMDAGYTPVADKAIITKEYADNLAGASPFQFDYRWTAGANITPASKHLSVNNADVTLATRLYIHKIDRAGRDMSLLLGTIGAGDWVNIHEHSNIANAYSFDVVGTGVFVGDVFEVDVTFYVPPSPAGAIIDNDRVDVFWKHAADITDQPLLAKGTIDLIGGYTPPNALSVATKKYVDDNVGNTVKSVPNATTGEVVVPNMVAITQAEYDAIGAGNYDPDTLYMIVTA